MAAALDVPVTVAGVLFVLVVVADNLTPPDREWAWLWVAATWVLWALFVIEFGVRLVVSPSMTRFMRRNWWQLLFLAVPFLRFTRAFTRSARVAKAVASSVRSTRTAGGVLGTRLAYLGSASAGVILAASQLLHEFGPGVSYPDALHHTALATISGEPFGLDGAVARSLELLLALYATVFFAALAGSLGAFFLERRRESRSSTSP